MNTTKTQSLEQWLQDCPDKIQFYSRFLDIKSDIQLTLEAEVITVKGSREKDISPEQLEFAERLKLLEQRKSKESHDNEDMWSDD